MQKNVDKPLLSSYNILFSEKSKIKWLIFYHIYNLFVNNLQAMSKLNFCSNSTLIQFGFFSFQMLGGHIYS